MIQIFRVLHQGVPQSVTSTKAENGMVSKCTIVLQEYGSIHGPTYACTLLGNSAHCKFSVGEIVMASLRFHAVEFNGKWFQDITVNSIDNLKLH